LVQRVYIGASIWVTEPAYNKIRALVGAPPVNIFNLYFQRMIITPSIYGLDLAQPLCPNVHPVGFLARVARGSSLSESSVPLEWQSFMDGCTSGLIYMNMGSVAVLPDEWLHRFEGAAVRLATERGHCVVWKVTKKQHDKIADANAVGPMLRITEHIPFSPRLLLAHPNTKVFITHCGDTSVYESVQNEVTCVRECRILVLACPLTSSRSVLLNWLVLSSEWCTTHHRCHS
jgi:hypothetical protein